MKHKNRMGFILVIGIIFQVVFADDLPADFINRKRIDQKYSEMCTKKDGPNKCYYPNSEVLMASLKLLDEIPVTDKAYVEEIRPLLKPPATAEKITALTARDRNTAYVNIELKLLSSAALTCKKSPNAKNAAAVRSTFLNRMYKLDPEGQNYIAEIVSLVVIKEMMDEGILPNSADTLKRINALREQIRQSSIKGMDEEKPLFKKYGVDENWSSADPVLQEKKLTKLIAENPAEYMNFRLDEQKQAEAYWPKIIEILNQLSAKN